MTPTTPSQYPIELLPPDITAHKPGNTGIDYIWSFASERDGPHVMIAAVTHGNELCGAIVVDEFLRQGLRPQRGRLTLAFINVAAFHAFDPKNPTASRFVDEDFNRLWKSEVLDGPRDSVELRRARELRPVLDSVDYLLDIHSMQHKTPPLMMAGPLPKGRELAAEIGVPELVVTDSGHVAGRRMRDYAGFSDPVSEKNALLVECGQHWEAAAAPRARETARRFLANFGTVPAGDEDTAANKTPPQQQRFIEVTTAVTIQSHDFTFANDYRGGEVIEEAGTLLGHDGEEAVVTPYDNCILIMPSRRLKMGQTAVRLGRFVPAPKTAYA